MVNKAHKRRGRVPVTNRTKSGRRPDTVVSARAQGAGGRFSALQVGILIGVLILVLVMIAVPVRNYFQQRAEISRLNASIVERSERREMLIEEIDKYRSDAYVREQARKRLGVIERGETPFRVIDPEITASTTTGSGERDTAAPVSTDWWTVLWNSVANRDSGVSFPGSESDPGSTEEPGDGIPPSIVQPQPDAQTDPAPAD
ncbi:septum formation initiator family protein [Corynebacterium sp. CCM 9204]|uniref:FtsB family cell division protein n=1 Tax=Corynebacterium sp. CCM 9204 TaxID=3057616 RepID=UPI0035249242